jgi:hypothetical protein
MRNERIRESLFVGLQMYDQRFEKERLRTFSRLNERLNLFLLLDVSNPSLPVNCMASIFLRSLQASKTQKTRTPFRFLAGTLFRLLIESSRVQAFACCRPKCGDCHPAG